MFNGDRIKRPSVKLIALIIAVILAILALSGGISYGIGEQLAYEQAAQERSADYAEYARRKETYACLNVIAADQANCKKQAQAEYELAKRDNQRNEYDLVSQRKSALWTFVMGVAALIGMGLSIIGVVLVWTTFRETRRAATAAHDANQISKDALEAQVRPWIKMKVEFYEIRMNGKTLSVTCKAFLENVGQAPACFLSLVPSIEHEEMSSPQILNRVPSYFGPEYSEDRHNRILFQNDSWQYMCVIESENFPIETKAACVVVAVIYKSSGGDVNHLTVCVHDFVDSRNFNADVDFSKDNFGYMNLLERSSFPEYAD